jgi:outer membrane protein
MSKAALAALLAAIAGVLSAPASMAQSRIITFNDAVKIALDQNATLKQAETAAELDEVGVTEARMQFVPNLTLNTSTAQNYGRNFNQSEGQIIDQSSRSASLGVSSGVVLFDGFGNTASLQEAKLTEAASNLDVQRTRETVVFTVASNFLSLIQQREQLRVQRENLSAETALEEQIQSYVNAGARTIADLYQQQANVASARFAVVAAERAAELANVDLMQTLQLDPHGVYEFQAPAPESLASAGEPADLTELLDRAYAQRTDLDAQQSRVDAAEQSIRVARSGYWPRVSLNAGYNSAYTSTSDFDFFDQIDQRRGGSIGVGISIPLFDRNSVQIASRRAELRVENARIALESQVNDVGLQVRRAHLDYRAAQEQLSAAQAQQRAAELALQAAQDRYQAGASTLVELSQARALQVQAASALVSARYNLLFQRTLMDYYVGDLDVARLSGS